MSWSGSGAVVSEENDWSRLCRHLPPAFIDIFFLKPSLMRGLPCACNCTSGLTNLFFSCLTDTNLSCLLQVAVPGALSQFECGGGAASGRSLSSRAHAEPAIRPEVLPLDLSDLSRLGPVAERAKGPEVEECGESLPPCSSTLRGHA